MQIISTVLLQKRYSDATALVISLKQISKALNCG
jgi:hypothetical protein